MALYNDSSGGPPEDVREILSQKYFQLSLPKTIFQIFLCAFGILGNTVLLVICYRRKIKNSAMVYIGALAVVDLFACLFVIPFQILSSWQYYTHENVISCKVFEWFKMSTVAASCLLFMAIAVDRYQAICHPFTWRSTGVRKSLIIATISIVFGVACMVPELLLIGLQDYKVNETIMKFDFPPERISRINLNLTCHVCEHLNKFDGSWELTTYLFIVLGIFLVLVAVSFICYIRIAWVMATNKRLYTKTTGFSNYRNSSVGDGYKSSRSNSKADDSSVYNKNGGSENIQLKVLRTKSENCDCESGSPQRPQVEPVETSRLSCGQNHTAQERKLSRLSAVSAPATRPDTRQYSVSKALMVVTVVFLLSWTPFWAIYVYSLWQPHYHITSPASTTAILGFFEQLFFFNNAVNPVVYVIYSNEFRFQCKQVCHEVNCSKPQTVSSAVL